MITAKEARELSERTNAAESEKRKEAFEHCLITNDKLIRDAAKSGLTEVIGDTHGQSHDRRIFSFWDDLVKELKKNGFKCYKEYTRLLVIKW